MCTHFCLQNAIVNCRKIPVRRHHGEINCLVSNEIRTNQRKGARSP